MLRLRFTLATAARYQKSRFKLELRAQSEEWRRAEQAPQIEYLRVKSEVELTAKPFLGFSLALAKSFNE